VPPALRAVDPAPGVGPPAVRLAPAAGRPVHAEPDAPAAAGPALAAALHELAAFLGAEEVELRQPPPPVWRGALA